MPGRIFNLGGYRYGFNGKENDNEVKGDGNQQDYGMRIYDPRIGKFLSVDPLTKDYAYYTPYAFAGNMPIEAIDLDGSEPYKNAYKFAYKTDPTLNLFHSDNLVDMNGFKGTSYNSLGWARNSKGFWDTWKNTPLGKNSLSKNNLAIISKGGSPVVDEMWNGAMKQFGNDGVVDEVIHHHHLNKGRNAIPVPASRHIGEDAETAMHSMGRRGGKVSQLANKNMGRAFALINLGSLFLDSPNSILYTYHQMGMPSSEQNRAYPTNDKDAPSDYYEWRSVGKEGAGDRELIFFNDYKKIDGKWRGVDEVQRRTFDKEGKQKSTSETNL